MSLRNNNKRRFLDVDRRLTGQLTSQEIKKLPASLNNLQSSTELSRAQVLERVGLVNKAVENVDRKKRHKLESILIKDMKSKCEPMLGYTVKL